MIRILLAVCIALVIGITFHEASHAFVATLQGDSTARFQRRLSLNPARHLDQAGSLMMLLAGFGWGKPVPVNPYRLKSGPRVGSALVALAGPASNLILAALVALPVKLGLLPFGSAVPFASGNPAQLAGDLIEFVVLYNVILAVFNLIPIAPLDGFKVALGVLPRNLALSFQRLEPYGPGILMLVLLLGYMTGTGFNIVMRPLLRFLLPILLG